MSLVAGQATPSSPKVQKPVKPWVAPRTPDGHPDLIGVWNFSTLTPIERSRDGKAVIADEEAAQVADQLLKNRTLDNRSGGAAADVGRGYNDFWLEHGSSLTTIDGQIRTSLIVDPPDGRMPPLSAEGQESRTRFNAIRNGPAKRPEDRPAQERCILGFNAGPPITPGNYNNLIQIFQNDGYVALLNEMVHNARIIPTDGRPHGQVPQWMGDSRGRWEGDTLVVDTTQFFNSSGVTESTTFHGGGGGKRLHLIERFRRISADTLLYEATVDDPATWTKPWTMAFTMKKTDEPVLEYACHEGNYSLEAMLRAGGENKVPSEDDKK